MIMGFLNLTTVLSTVGISGYQFGLGVSKRYFEPFPSERVLIDRNMKAIRAYNDILK